VLGALYLAYDLLGGEHGPLRTVTRAVTYGAMFGTGYGLALGPLFGVITGIAHGITLGWEYARTSRNAPKPGVLVDATMSTIRAVGFGLGASFLFGTRFGIAFAVLSAVGQTLAYRVGIRPSADYQSARRPRWSRFLMLAAANRTVGYTIAGYLSSVIAKQWEHPIAVGLKTGLVIGVVTAVAGVLTPYIEWNADRIPEKRMGVFGVAMILTGFALQSLQYWVALLNVTVR
jgi:hypothetical protein